jgi:hypothetical protein
MRTKAFLLIFPMLLLSIFVAGQLSTTVSFPPLGKVTHILASEIDSADSRKKVSKTLEVRKIVAHFDSLGSGWRKPLLNVESPFKGNSLFVIDFYNGNSLVARVKVGYGDAKLYRGGATYYKHLGQKTEDAFINLVGTSPGQIL